MRKCDKLKVIQEANNRLEQEYLKSKGLIKEGDDLEWANDSLESKEGFDWLRHEPLDNLIGLKFDWDGQEYEITSAFDISQEMKDDDFEGETEYEEEGVYINVTIDGEDYDDSIPLEQVIGELEDGNAHLISD